MLEALDHLASWLIRHVPQYPFEFQDHSLGNEHVACCEHATSNAPLHRIVAEIKACKDVRVNCAHASLPFSSPVHRASGSLEFEGRRSEERRVGKECRSRWWRDQSRE